ncbi:MAG: aldo/keto reductase [Anaerolineae bacterium]|nr:aldo/keto reductase [Anaerolineae bacterium]
MIEKLPFGRTGHHSTCTLFGAAALWSCTQAEADQTLDVLLEYGVNHIDTAASYGEAELRIGPWMKRHRKDFFLATKTEQRTYQKAKEELQRSLDRLQTDHVDLWQIHAITEPEPLETALGPGGALEAFIEAREQGLVRFFGVTGHGTQIAKLHQRSLERFDFDSVLLPYNYLMMQNPQYAADFEALYKICREKKVAVQAIKSIARGPWGDKAKTRTCWYEPFEAQADIDRAVNYVLSRPGIFLNTVGDIGLLPKVLDAASRFQQTRPTDQEMQKMVEATAAAPLFV